MYRLEWKIKFSRNEIRFRSWAGFFLNRHFVNGRTFFIVVTHCHFGEVLSQLMCVQIRLTSQRGKGRDFFLLQTRFFGLLLRKLKLLNYICSSGTEQVGLGL